MACEFMKDLAPRLATLVQSRMSMRRFFGLTNGFLKKARTVR
jgi:hypothetical protein